MAAGCDAGGRMVLPSQEPVRAGGIGGNRASPPGPAEAWPRQSPRERPELHSWEGLRPGRELQLQSLSGLIGRTWSAGGEIRILPGGNLETAPTAAPTPHLVSAVGPHNPAAHNFSAQAAHGDTSPPTVFLSGARRPAPRLTCHSPAHPTQQPWTTPGCMLRPQAWRSSHPAPPARQCGAGQTPAPSPPNSTSSRPPPQPRPSPAPP